MNDQEQLLCDLWNAGASAQEIAQRVGVGKDAVYKWVRRFDLPINRRAALADSEEANPSEAEIAERARIQRELHFAKRRQETDRATDKAIWREDRNDRLRA
jgi:transposase